MRNIILIFKKYYIILIFIKYYINYIYNTLFSFSTKIVKIKKSNSVLKFDTIMELESPPRDIPLRLAECFPYIWKDRYATQQGWHSSWVTLDKNAKVSFVAVSWDLRENNTMPHEGVLFCNVEWHVYCKNYGISAYETSFSEMLVTKWYTRT